MVLDKGTPGGHGSRAAAGVAVPSLRLAADPPMAEFTHAGRSALRKDLASLNVDGLSRGSGILRLAVNEQARDELAAAGVNGFDVGRWVDGAELVELEPALEGTPAVGAWLDETAYMVDTATYLNALLHDAMVTGAEVRLGEAAVSVELESSAVRVVTDCDEVVAERVVLAGGAWSGRLPGVPRLPIAAVRGQMMTIFHPRYRLSRIVSGVSGYLAPWRGGGIVIGATEEHVGFSAHTSPDGLLYLSAAIRRTAPRLAGARVEQAWAGLRASGPNGRPLIGPVPGAEGIVVASGHAGQGILTGALTGELVLQVLDGARPPLVEPFSP